MMAYPKLPEWPIIDPESPPTNHLKLGEHQDKDRLNKIWYLYFAEGHLLIVSKTWVQFDESKPGAYVSSQYEYPIAGVRWFINTLERFFLHPDHPNTVPRGAITIEEDVSGQVLGVTRGAQYGSMLKNIPGYSFDNLNRFRHSTLSVDDNWCQMFEMGDPWLFDYGLLDLFKEIADRHEQGEF